MQIVDATYLVNTGAYTHLSSSACRIMFITSCQVHAGTAFVFFHDRSRMTGELFWMTRRRIFCAVAFCYVLSTKKKDPFFVILFCSNFFGLEALGACPKMLYSNFHDLVTLSSKLASFHPVSFLFCSNFPHPWGLVACLKVVPLRQPRSKIVASTNFYGGALMRHRKPFFFRPTPGGSRQVVIKPERQ